ncbi:glycosyltransferase [Xanthomonas sp. NCPPB 1068]|uniref:glycosyltransferase n=1 Tax=Xanthomonas sp. NCPPB 1068 TaxID=487525 RepID=UPI0035591E62
MRLIKEMKRGVQKYLWRAMPVVRRRAASVPLLRKIYFGSRHVAWRAKCTFHLVMGLMRSSSIEYEGVRASGLFHDDWYAERYANHLAGVTDYLAHFMKEGADKGFWPNPLFDPEWYARSSSDVARLHINPLAHYIYYGASEGRRPVPLFDTAFYLGAYPDVAESGMNPLAHFLAHGARELRDPHPLFSTQWYISNYQDVALAGLNPLVHYMASGAYEGRDPNQFFNSAWYLSKYQDVARAKKNPLEHYAFSGYLEGRQPGPAFDTRRYLADHPDVAVAGMDPLLHYLRIGRAESRAQPLRLMTVDDVAPSREPAHEVDVSRRMIDVIIPVYRGIEETSRCIESYVAASASNSTPARLVVINDCSPDPQMHVYLEEAAARFGFLLLKNEVNLGFVGTANRGMALGLENDVLLLNSDTEVANDWLDRIVAHADLDPRVATVTPLSNNATICSYPEFSGRRKLPAGVSVKEMDQVCADANRGRSVSIPTGVGYCMLVKRACLDEIGLFDEDAFGKGYGEENDLCMRAMENGWKNILAMDTFVFHAGEVSFAAGAAAGKQAGATALLRKHPRYNLEVGSHVAEDPGRVYRLAITAQLWKVQRAKVMLLVSHGLGGGTERHVQELTKRYAKDYKILTMRPSAISSSSGIALRAWDDYSDITVDFAFSNGDELAALLVVFPVTAVHVHHLYGYGPEVEQALVALGVPFDFTAHDYFTVCPQINLSSDGVSYCGEPDPAGCNACILRNDRRGVGDIRSWRLRYEWVLRDARRVIAPSIDAAERIRGYAPDANVTVVHHEETPQKWRHARPQRCLGAQDVLRVGVIGVLARHKGRELLINAAIISLERNLPIEFIVIGDPQGELPPSTVAAVRTTGRYLEDELASILDSEKPDVLLFASRWPETYSYTLSAGLEAGLPVIVPDIGAFSERVSGRPWSFVIPADVAPDALVTRLLALRDVLGENTHTETLLPERTALIPTSGPDAGYSQEAMQRLPVPQPRPLGDRLRIVVVMEIGHDIPSPCAHIRLMAFFDAMQARGQAWVRYVRARDVVRYRADVIVTHRTAVTTLAEAEALSAYAARHKIPLIYDLDDNLTALDPHAENGRYQPLLAVVHHFSASADVIWASTPALCSELQAAGASNVEVHRNALDPTVWEAALKRSPTSGLSDPVRILYMGTMTHNDDLMMVSDGLKELKNKHGGGVDISLIGVKEGAVTREWYSALAVPPSVGGSYPAFASWIGSITPFDIGISPLRDTRFNRSKSEIKVLDYAALGLAPVVSDLEPYRSTVTHGVNGMLVAEQSSDWFEALDRLVSNRDLRHQMAVAARAIDFGGDFDRAVADRFASMRRAVEAHTSG